MKRSLDDHLLLELSLNILNSQIDVTWLRFLWIYRISKLLVVDLAIFVVPRFQVKNFFLLIDAIDLQINLNLWLVLNHVFLKYLVDF